VNKPEKSPAKSRSQVIKKAGWLFILTNFLLAVFNIIIGLISHSLAITSDATHSLIDSISGVLIIGSEKLATRKKYEEKREKIERITTIAIALIIIAAGIHIIVEAIEKIIEAEEVEFDVWTVIVLLASLAAKYALAIYLKRSGKKHNSTVLTASGAETMNDALISVAVLASTIVYLIWHVDIEAYISFIISAIIIKVGLEFIFPHLSRHHHHPLETNPDHDHCHQNHK
jgi:cation diffusion facilitator family transporter